MASSWQPSIPTQLSDYYRPHAPLNLGRPPKPGPRQPDCWRPGRRISPPPVRIIRAERKQSNGDNPGNSKQFKSKNKGNSDWLRKRKANLERTGSNKAPLGKRQMGIINSIIRSDEQSNEVTKVDRGLRDQSKAPMIEKMALEETPKAASGEVRQETSVGKTNNTSVVDTAESEMSTSKPLTPRPDLPFQLPFTSDETEWSRTKITEIPSIAPHEPISSTTTSVISKENPTTTADPYEKETLSSTFIPIPQLRQKLDFGNRVDQCLLKMDKWADAWLSSALITEDPNPNPDNAWQSFEHCLSMPDVLEDREIIEYEEVPRCELPVTETSFGRVKRRWDGGQSAETLVDESCGGMSPWTGSREKGGEVTTIVEPTLPSVALGKRSWDGTFLESSNDETNRTDFREANTLEFRSSSPEYKRVKVLHIPSAATLREEARTKKMLE